MKSWLRSPTPSTYGTGRITKVTSKTSNVRKAHKNNLLIIFQHTTLSGGNPNALLKVAKILNDIFNIYVCVPKKDQLYELLEDENSYKIFIINKNIETMDKIKRFFDLYRIIKQYRITIITHFFTYDSFSMLILKIIFGVKLALFFGAERLTWKHRLVSHFYDMILVISEGILELSEIKTRKLDSIPLNKQIIRFFDRGRFFINKSKFKKRSKEFSNIINIGYMGRIDRNKGLLEILESIRILEEKQLMTNFFLMGDEVRKNEKEYIMGEAKDRNVLKNIIFINASNSEKDKDNFFDEIDIFCIPSYSEGMPIVVYESFSHGIPVIATKVGVLPFYFTDQKDIIFVKKKDANDLANAIYKLYLDEELYLSIVSNNKQFISEIDFRAMNKELRKLFLNL